MARQHPPSRESWSTRIGVILAVTGGAVGLGNFLRFPGLAARYEGGAFMVPYFVALFVLGIPLAWAEWALGRYGGSRGLNSGPGIFRAIWPWRGAPYVGALVVFVPASVYMYYVFVEAWCLGYAWHMAAGHLNLGGQKAPYLEFFDQFVGARHHGSLFGPEGLGTLGFVAFCAAANLVLVYRGLARGIEWFCRLAMPALVFCALLVLVRVLTLGTPDPQFPERNVLAGLGFTWNPRTAGKGFLESLANAQMWMDAAGQIFFSVAIGFGIIITYASYLKPDDDIALSGLTSCAGNEFCEVALGGMITIPAAFVFLGPAVVLASAQTSSFDLGFKTLPMVFQAMPLGQWVGTLFFLLLFLAAITSSVAMLQPCVAFAEEGLGLRRGPAVALIAVVTTAGLVYVLWFSAGQLALDTLDFWGGTFAIYVLATVQAILFGGVRGVDRGLEELRRGAEIRIPRGVGFLIKYVSPAYLLGVFAMWLYQNLTASPERNAFVAVLRVPEVCGSVVLLGVLAAVLIAAVAAATRRRRLEPQPLAREAAP